MSNESASGLYSGSIPAWHERQTGVSGVTYSDPDLHDQIASAHREKEIAYNNYPAPVYPVSFKPAFGQFSWGLMKSDRPHHKVMPDKDHQPISHVGMFSEMLGTPHPGWYLGKK